MLAWHHSLLRKRAFRRKHVVDAPFGGVSFRGRVAVPSGRRAGRECVGGGPQGLSRRTMDAMCSWLDKVLAWSMKRSSLVRGFDLN
eukprot:9132393-Pyramimonas_sp.AAC.1